MLEDRPTFADARMKAATDDVLRKPSRGLWHVTVTVQLAAEPDRVQVEYVVDAETLLEAFSKVTADIRAVHAQEHEGLEEIIEMGGRKLPAVLR